MIPVILNHNTGYGWCSLVRALRLLVETCWRRVWRYFEMRGTRRWKHYSSYSPILTLPILLCATSVGLRPCLTGVWYLGNSMPGEQARHTYVFTAWYGIVNSFDLAIHNVYRKHSSGAFRDFVSRGSDVFSRSTRHHSRRPGLHRLACARAVTMWAVDEATL